ncbi:MAG: hypothetical protein PHI28_01055, partial [Mangrovibacterium sp.]|nr:hypothetical protein [Mangrovibacterium sp.]
MKEDHALNRRSFLSKTAIGTIGTLGTIHLLQSCSGSKKEKITLPELLDQAPDGKPLKAGLVGCGGRGTG